MAPQNPSLLSLHCQLFHQMWEEVGDADPSTTLPLLPTITAPTEDSLEVGSTADEDDAAQFAASQSSDGSAPSASAAIASAAQRKLQK
eukprot:633861-Amphidinium_carterae.1